MVPFYRFDPFMNLLMGRFGLGPVLVAVIAASFLIMLSSLAVITGKARISKTHSNPDGHGIFAAINAYLLVMPLTQLLIANYYLVYEHALSGIVRTGPLESSFRISFAGPLHWVGYFTYLVLLFVAFGCCWFQWRKPTHTETWLCDCGRPTVVCWFFYLGLFGIWGSVTVNWLVAHVIVWQKLSQALDLSGQLYAPDRIFGLSFLSPLILSAYLVIISIVLLVATWILGARVTLPRRRALRHPGVIAASIVLAIAGPPCLLAPLWGLHERMAHIKTDALEHLSIQVVKASNVEGETGGLSLRAARSELLLYDLTRRYHEIERVKTWPLSVPTVWYSTLGTITIWLLNPMVVELTERIWHKKRVRRRKVGGASVLQ